MKKIILKRLDEYCLGGRADNQYDISKNRSIIDAIFKVSYIVDWAMKNIAKKGGLCVFIFIDVKNAFNSAS